MQIGQSGSVCLGVSHRLSAPNLFVSTVYKGFLLRRPDPAPARASNLTSNLHLDPNTFPSFFPSLPSPPLNLPSYTS